MTKINYYGVNLNKVFLIVKDKIPSKFLINY